MELILVTVEVMDLNIYDEDPLQRCPLCVSVCMIPITMIMYSCIVNPTEMRTLETRPTHISSIQQPTAPLPTTGITASDMFLPYQRPTYGSSVTKRFCAQGMFFYKVKLRDGWNAGMLLQVARVDDMTECIQLCCDELACDFVMLKERRCYTVRCKGGDTCTVEEGGEYQISFVSRQGEALALKFCFSIKF